MRHSIQLEPEVALPATGPYPEYAESSPYLRLHKLSETPFMTSKEINVKIRSSCLQYSDVRRVSNVSEEYIVSIFRIEM